MIPSVLDPPRALTVRDLERLPEGAPYELIEGVLYHRTLSTPLESIEDALEFLDYLDAPLSPAPLPIHQFISDNLLMALGGFVRRKRLGRVVSAPVDVQLAPGTIVQPDLVFVAAHHLDRIGTKRIEGAPDLVVEILSSSTRHQDKTGKRAAYERAGVLEYWIIDPKPRGVEVYVLTDEGYRLAAAARAEGEVASGVVPGFSITLADLFEGV